MSGRTKWPARRTKRQRVWRLQLRPRSVSIVLHKNGWLQLRRQKGCLHEPQTFNSRSGRRHSAGRVGTDYGWDGSDIFRQAIRDQVAQGNKKILLNLEDVSYIDSSGLGELVLGHGTVTQNICDSCGASIFQNDQQAWDPCPRCKGTGRTTWGALKLTNLNIRFASCWSFHV